VGKGAVPLAAHSAYAPPPPPKKKFSSRNDITRAHRVPFFGCRTPQKHVCARCRPPKKTNVEAPIGRRGGRSYSGRTLVPPTFPSCWKYKILRRRSLPVAPSPDRAASGGVTGKGWRTSGRFRFILAPHWSASCGHRVFAVSQWRDRLELDGVDDDEKKEKGPYAICWRDVSRPIYRTGRRGGCARHASRAIHGRGAWRIEQHLHVPFWTTRSLGMRFAQPGNTAT
jgi:hypothetical protein